MPSPMGTRTKQTAFYSRIDQGAQTRFLQGDPGMTKLVTASLTFAASGATITGANGTFTGTFAVNDPILVEGADLNNGYFTVTGLDTTNAAYLTVDPPPKNEGPLTVLVRTP